MLDGYAVLATASGSTTRWRLCFRWSEGDALDVEIVDYH